VSDFAAALRFVLAREGGFVDDPADPGGRTNLGITQRAWDAWRTNNAPDAAADVAALTADSPYVAAFYQAQYWRPCGCDTLDQGPALALFDTAVNLGVARARSLWEAAGDVPTFLWARLAYYDELVRVTNPRLAKFIGGWLHRVLLLREATT
jgi:lysozyme family protein